LEQTADLIEKNLLKFSDNGQVIDGANLLSAKNAISDMIKGLPRYEKQAAAKGMGVFDDIIRDTLSASKTGMGDLANFDNVSAVYPEMNSLFRAAEKAKVKGGQFTPAQLIASSPKGSTQRVIGRTAQEVLGGPRANSWRNLAGGALSVYGLATNPVAALGVIGAGNVAASRTFQKAAMGDLAAQKKLADMIRNNPNVTEAMGRYLRSGAVNSLTGDQ
jgi:hypothetical protein